MSAILDPTKAESAVQMITEKPDKFTEDVDLKVRSCVLKI